MKVYPSAPLNTMPAAREAPGGTPGIAVRLADLVSASGRPAAEGDRTALVVAGTPVIRTGDVAVFAAATAGSRRAGIPLTMPGWGPPSSSSMSCSVPA